MVLLAINETKDISNVCCLFRVFALDNLEDYEQHFTVMNYQGTSLKQVCYQKLSIFCKQDAILWPDVVLVLDTT